MDSLSLIHRRMVAYAAGFAAYGLWVGCVYLPGNVGPGTRLVSVLLSVAIAVIAGAGLGLLSATLSTAATRGFSARLRAKLAAGIETAILTPLFLWLVLNEALYALTDEVLGSASLRVVWHTPAAVFQNAWAMAGRYLLLIIFATLVFAVIAYRGLLRSHRSNALPSRARRRMLRRSFVAALAFLFALLAWQFHGQPGNALAALSRSSPPLRALNLARALVGDELRADSPGGFRPPIVSLDDYARTMRVGDEPLRNVVLIFLESVPARALGCYGYPRDVTPNMDALARDGALFEHCVAAASFSSYGVVSVMTSLYLLRDELNDHFADASFPQVGIQKVLRLAGLETALFSSGNETFDNIEAFYPPTDFDTYFAHNTADVPKPDCMRMDDRYANEAFEQWIDSRTDDRPFFVMFNLQSTHFNYEVPAPWDNYYQPTPPLYSNGDGIIHIPADVLPLLRNQYDNALRYLDHYVGRIRDALERNGELADSLIVILGDHGEAFMEHGLARHGVHLYEEFVHIPLVMYAPGLIEPCRITDTVSSIDIAPTIAGRLGLKPHPSWQGMDVLADDYTGRDRPIFSVLQLARWQEAVVLNRVKYIYDLAECRGMLFDLASDPSEKNDLSDSRPQLRERMHGLLSRWHTRQLDYYDTSNRPFTRYVGRLEFPQP